MAKWKNMGDVWVDDEGNVSETDPDAPTADAAPDDEAEASSAAPAAPAPYDPEVSGPLHGGVTAPKGYAKPLPGRRPGVVWRPRTLPLPEAPDEAALYMQESRGGQDKAHPPNDGLHGPMVGTVSGGSAGLKPDTAKEIIKNDPVLRQKYGNLLSLPADAMTNHLNLHDDVDDDISLTGWRKIMAKHHGDPHAARMEWRWGSGGARRAERLKKEGAVTDEDRQFLANVNEDLATYDGHLAKATMRGASSSLMDGATADANGAYPSDAMDVNYRPDKINVDDPIDLNPTRTEGDPINVEQSIDLKGLPITPPRRGMRPQDRAVIDPAGANKAAIEAAPRLHMAGPPAPTGRSELNDAVANAVQGTPSANGAVADILGGAASAVLGPRSAAQRESAAQPSPANAVSAGVAKPVDPGTLDFAPAPAGPPGGAAAAPAKDPQESRFDTVMSELDAQRKADQAWNDVSLQKLDAMRQDALSGKIDPEHIFGGHGSAHRIMAAIALGLGAAGGALSHSPNAAQEIITSAINADIESQKEQLGRKVTVYSQALQQFGNDRLARQAATQILWDQARVLMAEMKAQGAGKMGKPEMAAQQVGQGLKIANAVEKDYREKIGTSTADAIYAWFTKHIPDNPLGEPSSKMYSDTVASNAEMFMKTIPGIRHTPENVARVRTLFPVPGGDQQRNANRIASLKQSLKDGTLFSKMAEAGVEFDGKEGGPAGGDSEDGSPEGMKEE